MKTYSNEIWECKNMMLYVILLAHYILKPTELVYLHIQKPGMFLLWLLSIMVWELHHPGQLHLSSESMHINMCSGA